jgi:hypothetical protein
MLNITKAAEHSAGEQRIPSLWTTVVGQPEGAGSGKRQCREREPGQIAPRFSFAHPSGRLYGPPCSFPGAKNSAFNPPCLPTPSQSPPRAQHGSTRIKHNGYRLIADATAIGSGTTLPGATIGRTGKYKRVYIGLSERLVFLSTGSASQRRGGNGGWRLGL